MPRAHRYHLPPYVWHITHRCHRKQFLLQFARDRRAWIRWLYAARMRYGLCVLDYAVTSNHIHRLVRDQGHGEIERGLRRTAGRGRVLRPRLGGRNGPSKRQMMLESGAKAPWVARLQRSDPARGHTLILPSSAKQP